jgi:cytochrome P450
VEPNGIWAISRYDDIVAAFKNTQVFSSEGLRMASEPPWLGRHNPLSDSMILSDPPRHGRLRGLISRAFTANMIKRVESYAREAGQQLAEELFQKEEVDFVSEFAVSLPTNVLALLIGVDPSLQTYFKRWADDLTGINAVSPDDHQRVAEVRASLEDMENYLRGLMARRRRKPEHDLVSDLVQVRVEGEALSDEEVLAFLSLLLVAGLETTVGLMTHTVMLLARHPEWMGRLRENETLTVPFIEEVLRYEPPLHSTLRLTTQETEVAGVRLPAYAPVMLLVGSGLHDETQFEEPERFNPERRVPSNLVFGHGPHFCLGAPLARMEARIALEALLAYFSGFELRTDKLQWNMSLLVRSPVALPVKCVRSASRPNLSRKSLESA